MTIETPGPGVLPHRFEMPTRTGRERDFLANLEVAARNSQTSYVEKFANFPLWAPRQNVARFLAQWHVYREHILHVHGSIIECGVAFGSGLAAWAHFASIMEPANHTRRVIGFDTFSGFPGMAKEDDRAESKLNHAGGMAAPVDDEIAHLAMLHDHNRPNGHIPRVELVKGDACQTIREFVERTPSLVVAALVLDFDIYEPTKVALDVFMHRMPKGSVVIWDELGVRDWPGETLATLPYLRDFRIRRLPFTSTMSYAVVGE